MLKWPPAGSAGSGKLPKRVHTAPVGGMLCRADSGAGASSEVWTTCGWLVPPCAPGVVVTALGRQRSSANPLGGAIASVLGLVDRVGVLVEVLDALNLVQVLSLVDGGPWSQNGRSLDSAWKDGGDHWLTTGLLPSGEWYLFRFGL